MVGSYNCCCVPLLVLPACTEESSICGDMEKMVLHADGVIEVHCGGASRKWPMSRNGSTFACFATNHFMLSATRIQEFLVTSRNGLK